MYSINLDKKTLKNNNYRKVLKTTPQTQLVLMSLKPGEDIPKEKHENITQFIKVEDGCAKVQIGNKNKKLKSGDAIIIPPNVYHYVKNCEKTLLKMYILYSPPEHRPNLIQKKKPLNE